MTGSKFQTAFETNNNFSNLVFPVHGKQLTMGILEQGKPCKDRLTQRRSITTGPSDGKWGNPSENGTSNRGYSKYVSHDQFFFEVRLTPYYPFYLKMTLHF